MLFNIDQTMLPLKDKEKYEEEIGRAHVLLAKSDQMRQMAERNYGEQEVRNVRNEAMENAEQREVIQRSR